MRKKLPIILLALFPYLIVFILICIFTGWLMDTVFLVLLFLLLVLYIVTLTCSLYIFIASNTKKIDLLEVLRMNMIIKLIHIPAYIIIFVVGFFCMITIFTMGLTILLVLLDGMTIALSGLIGLGGVIRCVRDKKISLTVAVLHGILQFVFCIDIISGVVIYRKVKVNGYHNSHNLKSV